MVSLADKVLQELESRAPVKGPDHKGNFQTLCLFHEETQPSFYFHPERGYNCFGCNAKGGVRALAEHLGIKVSEGRKIVETYDYHDENHNLLHQTVRYEPKKFKQRRPDGNGGWTWSLRGVRTVIFNLPEVKKAIEQGKLIYMPEGEKDCKYLKEKLGLVATTNPMGAGKWEDSYSESLRGADLIIIPDNDDAGHNHKLTIANSVYGKAKRIRILEIPREYIDISDWLANDRAVNINQLEKLLAKCADFVPSVPQYKYQASGLELGNYSLTDYGNAERLVKRHGNNIRYCYERGKWLIWNSRVWEWDYGARILQLAKETARSILIEAAAEENNDKYNELIKHAKSSESEARLNAIVNLAKSEPGIAITIQELNYDLFLFNCINGTINLKTGQLQPHDRSNYCTIIAPVEYHLGAISDRWQSFLDRITRSDTELQNFIKRCAGMCLTGDISAQVMLFPFGTGKNGKSTFLMCLWRVMGDYASVADPDTFMDIKSRSGGSNENLANLYGKRFVYSTEPEEGRKLAVSRVKAMTGGEAIQASRKYEHEVTWIPTHKVWLSGNHKPTITDTTHSIWRRVKLIPFTVEIPENERIEGFADLLFATEREVILRWLVEGCLEWQSKGLCEPQAVISATQEYRGEMDIIAPFIEDCCVLGSNEDVTKAALYERYKGYCDTNGERALGKKKFGERIREKGLDEGRVNDAHLWIGIGLQDNT